VQGYCLTLKLLGEAIQRGAVDGIQVPLVSTTSGVLDPYGRKLLNSALGARVVDIYAAEESGGAIAWECPKCSGYHINSDMVIVEFTKHGQPVHPGEDAEIVITNLTGYTMPFIRYALGDVARMSTTAPSCGRSLPLMESISGRSGDYIVLTSGRKIIPHPFFLVMDETAGIGEWQLVQEDLRRLIVRLTMPCGSDPKRIQQIRKGLKELVGESVTIEVEVVEQLRKNPFEKLRSVISRVETPGGVC
jgi:phenylacetate-CoA ligase